jgi:hypothetical protein
MAGLWCRQRAANIERNVSEKAALTIPDHAGAWTLLGRAVRRAALGLALAVLPGCSELAQPSETATAPEPPPYVSIAAKYLLSTLKDRDAYDSFAISGLRWFDSIKGWAWLACVHFKDHGHLRSYAVFIEDNAVVDARYAVETDACDAQNYTQFDLLTGVLGQPTPPVQPPLY